MARRLAPAALLGAVLAVVLAFVTQQLANVGGVPCDVYCGPGAQALPLGWMIMTAAVWLTALVLSVASLVATRARSGVAWGAVAVSAVLPLALAFLATHPASGS